MGIQHLRRMFWPSWADRARELALLGHLHMAVYLLSALRRHLQTLHADALDADFSPRNVSSCLTIAAYLGLR